MKYKFLFMFVLTLMLIGIASASLGTFKQNEVVNIRVLANCSVVNLTEVTIGQSVYTINSPMTLLGGQTFNYNFTNTHFYL